MPRNQMNIVFPYCLLQFAIPVLPKESLVRFILNYSFNRYPCRALNELNAPLSIQTKVYPYPL